jgi:hypothetical protein
MCAFGAGSGPEPTSSHKVSRGARITIALWCVPKRRDVLTGASPAWVRAGSPGSRLQLGGDNPTEPSGVSKALRQEEQLAGRNSRTSRSPSARGWGGNSGAKFFDFYNHPPFSFCRGSPERRTGREFACNFGVISQTINQTAIRRAIQFALKLRF